MSALPLRAAEEHRIYDLLHEQIGFDEFGTWKGSFLQCTETGCEEYRIQGKLGFGGKLRNCHGRIYIDCYPEDINQERQVLIDRVNATFVQWSKEGLLPKFRGA